MAPTTATHWGTSTIAAKLNVTANTVSKWIDRYADTDKPFPRSDVTIEDTNGRVTRGWAPERWPEIERWATVDRHTVRLPGNPQHRVTASADS